jgi:predicted ribosome quality control (RQC) complex YloA/Tae2 family protein
MKEYEYNSRHDDKIFQIRIGESAQENWDLIDKSFQNDIWFHVHNQPSCHVVLTVDDYKKTPHKSVLNYCATLCKEGSKVKTNKNITVIYTLIKNVKKSGNPGSVTTTNTYKIKC